MKKMFLPQVRIPLARRVNKIDKKTGKLVMGKDGQIEKVWDRGVPLGFIYHWKSAAVKLRHFKKSMDEWNKNRDKWFNAVAVYEGIDNNLWRYINYRRKPYTPPPALFFDWENGRWFPVAE